MGYIPILSDKQVKNLKRIVGTNQKINLVPNEKLKSRRFPSEEKVEISDDKYEGYFALRDASTYTSAGFLQTALVLVVDGAFDSATRAGWTDLGEVASSSLRVPGTKPGNGDIWLYAAYSSGAKSSGYVQGFATSATSAALYTSYGSGSVVFEEIGQAYVSGGTVYIGQTYSGGQLNWGERYYI